MALLLFLLTQISLAQTSSRTEVQVNVCENLSSISQKLQLNTWKAKASEKSHLVDNRHLDLYKANFTLKIKIDEFAQQAEVILKHNQILTADGTTQTSADCEYDLHGSQKKLACKMTNNVALSEFNRLSQNNEFTALLSSEQLNWLNELQVQLPQNLQMTTEFQDQDYVNKLKSYKIVLGVSKNSRQHEFIEISTRTTANDELAAQSELLSHLNSKNIQICSDQNSIFTRLKLESFFKQSP